MSLCLGILVIGKLGIVDNWKMLLMIVGWWYFI